MTRGYGELRHPETRSAGQRLTSPLSHKGHILSGHLGHVDLVCQYIWTDAELGNGVNKEV